MRILPSACILALPALLGAQAPAWPTPKGWRSERMALPTDFAPKLLRKGSEDIRFMPGFFDPKAEGFWSYAFAWELDSGGPKARALDAPALVEDLELYFKGLAEAVAPEKGFKPDPAAVRARLTGGSAATLSGTVTVLEPFVTGKPLTLQVEVRILGTPGRPVALFAFSPQPLGHPVWKRLQERLDAHPAAKQAAKP